MEVLVLAANGGANSLLDVVLGALQIASNTSRSSTGPIVSRTRLDRGFLSAIIGTEQDGEIPAPNTSRLNTVGSSPTGPFESGNTSHLLRKIGRKSKKIKFLSEQVDSFRAKAEDATQKAQHLEMEQEQFFDDVRQMKAQFDKLAENHSKLMWEYLPARDPSLRAIPRLTVQLPETPTAVGKYPLDQVLGYGQYAVVYTSSTPERPELAVKAIDKQKLADLVSLHRVSSEIASLSDPAIRHSGILELVDVIHTRKYVYLITERGGKDLFEFFGAHTDGLKEETVRSLLLRLAQAVEVLHRNNYCHRDLKPENVLYAPEDSHLIKLIDFGLCTKAVTEQDRVLNDFCGSPGFFAPELLLHESYDGCKADVWSIGCILLEHCVVCTELAGIGEYAFLVNLDVNVRAFGPERTKTICRVCQSGKIFNARRYPFSYTHTWLSLQSLTRIRDFCHSPEWKYSIKLRNALLGMLCENPSKRFSINQVLDHPWLAESAPSHSTRRVSSPIKTKLIHGPSSAAARIPGTTTDVSIHPLPPRSIDYPPAISSAPGSPRHHHPTTKLSLPSLSPDKFSVTRV